MKAEKILVGLFGLMLVTTTFALMFPISNKQYVDTSDLNSKISNYFENNQPKFTDVLAIIWTGLTSSLKIIGTTITTAIPSVISDLNAQINLPNQIIVIITGMIVAPILIYLIRLLARRGG